MRGGRAEGSGPQPQAKLAARAILILLVIIGHNRILRDHYYYSLYIVIYAFHVGAFFLLATLSPPRALDRQSLASLLRKIVLPFLIFTLLYAALAQAIGLNKFYGGWEAFPTHYLTAIALANTWILDAVAGLKMLWFLPAFFVFCLLYNLYGALKGWARGLAVALALVAHLLIGEMPASVVDLAPWGANIVAFLCLPALLFSALAPHVDRGRLTRWLCVLLFAAASAFAIHNRYALILSDSTMPSLRRPIALLTGDIQLIFGTATCLIAGRWLASVRWIKKVGANSMKLYLLHPIANTAALKLFQPHLAWPAAMLLVSIVTIIVTMLLIELLDRTDARGLFG